MVRAAGKPKKPGPKKERLVIREDPETAVVRILKPTQTKALKAEFDAVHEEGMNALKRGNYDEFGTAIKREGKIVQRMFSKPARPLKRDK